MHSRKLGYNKNKETASAVSRHKFDFRMICPWYVWIESIVFVLGKGVKVPLIYP